MRIQQETTVWADATPNHIYVFDSELKRAIAYVPEGSNKVHKFRTPRVIDRRGRTFVELEDSEPELAANQWRGPGSRGEDHTVTLSAGTYSCTCPGYTYRGHCRHVAEQQQSQAVDMR